MDTTIYIALAAIFGLYMAWGIGANDVANAMATSIGSKAITIKQAIVIAAIFEFAGAVLAGGETTSTIRKGIIDTSSIGGDPKLLITGMLAALLGCAIWLNIATRFGWPVSTTHSIVGGIIGFALAAIGTEAVKWDKVGDIALSWLASPLTAGVIGFILTMTVRKLVLERQHVLAAAKRWIPCYIFLTGFLISLVTITKGLKHTGIKLDDHEALLVAIGVGTLLTVLGTLRMHAIVKKQAHKLTEDKLVERLFAVLMLITACAMAFAHGSNDVANAIGPMAAVVSTANESAVSSKAAVPIWMLLLGGAGIVLGLMTFGRRVIQVVGERITHLTPSIGFAAELAAATTVVVASILGMPVSTTHTLVGAILGVGIARNFREVDFRITLKIVSSWLITLPAGATLTIISFFVLKQFLY